MMENQLYSSSPANAEAFIDCAAFLMQMDTQQASERIFFLVNLNIWIIVIQLI